ncbi:hypothetical protein [Mesorhizobium sp. B2-3-6]|uniref:hypothetical protein n=1 Tax=Mesorhizobium sp. B2-3-6 TaxID=2589957 RepID=UPI0015E41838|nr:hypothetical protein [Mesorhizobium sp. B2-3-6]
MTGPLSTASRALDELVDVTADWSAEQLRRAADDMAAALDDAAMAAIEGATEWRTLATKDSRYAASRP